MGQLITNSDWQPASTGGDSQYARMIPGASAVPVRGPVKKPPVSSQGRSGASVTPAPRENPAKTLARVLLPHPTVEPFPLYLAVVADLVVLTISGAAQILFLPDWSLPVFYLPLFAVLTTLFAFTEGVYARDAYASPGEIVLELGRCVLFAVFLIFLADRTRMGIAAPLAMAANGFASMLLYRYTRRFTGKRSIAQAQSRNVLIVGGGPAARSITRAIHGDPLSHLRVRGCVDDELPLSATVLGRIADLDWLARAEFIDEVIVALPGRPDKAREAADIALRNHLDIRAVPDLPAGYWPEAAVDLIGDVPVITLHRELIPSASLFFKRLADLVCSAAALILTGPVMAVVALLIRLESPGPILYGAERVGEKGRPFRCYKFRSMVSNADNLKANLKSRNQREGPIFKIVDDPRITRVGRFIRRYSLDELPQLWNVLRGDMSLVGPRPHPVDEVNHYELHHYRRLDMKPGITGLWQITARHSPSFELNMHLDLTYIENWNLRLDLRILLGTIRVLFRPEGA